MTIDKLGKAYGSHVLFSDVNLEVEKGILYISGASGCGKSTLGNIIMGIEQADQGEVTFPGIPHPRFSYCGQEVSLLNEYSLLKNLKIFGIYYTNGKLNELVQELQFSPYVETPLYKLSGGELQKAEIIACLLKDSDIFILDEPFSSLDKEAKKRLEKILNDLAQRKLLIVINHDQTLVDLCIACRVIFKPTGIVSVEYSPDAQSGQNGEGKANSQAKRSNKPHLLMAVLKLYPKNNKLDFTLNLLLSLLAVMFFSLGCAFLDTKTNVENTLISLENDPFSVHGMIPDTTNAIDPTFFGDLDKDGYMTLELPVLGTDTSVTFVSSLSEDVGNSTFILSSRENSPIFKGEGKFYIAGSSYEVNLIGSDSTVLGDGLGLPAKEIIDGRENSNPLVLTTESFFDALFISGGGDSLKFEGDEEIFFGSLPGIIKSNDRYYLSSSENNIKIIGDNPGYSLAIKDQSPGSDVWLWNDDTPGKVELLKITSTMQSENQEVEMSLNQYKDFLVHASGSKLKGQEFFYYSFPDTLYQDILNAFGEVEVMNIIPSYSYIGVLKRNMYFGLSVVFFAVNLIYSLVSGKGKKKGVRDLLSAFTHQGVSQGKVYRSLALVSAFLFLPSLVLPFLFYPSVLIPLANFQNMDAIYKSSRPDGFYYFSQEPLNSYYDNIVSPIAFNTFEYLFLIVILFSILLFLAGFISTACAAQKTKD